jgi:shikimate kinase
VLKSIAAEINDTDALIVCKFHAEAGVKFDYEGEEPFATPDEKGIAGKVTANGDVTVTVCGGVKLQNGFGAW